MAKKDKIYFSKADFEKDFGPGALKKPVTGAGSAAGTKRTRDARAPAPYSKPTGGRPQRQQQQEEEELPGGYQPVRGRGQKRLNRRGGDAFEHEDRLDGSAGSGGGRGRSQGRGNGGDWGFQQKQQQPPPLQAQQQPKKRPGGMANATALATAKVIVSSAGSHPRKGEIKKLLEAYEKGWVPPQSFHENLQKLLV